MNTNDTTAADDKIRDALQGLDPPPPLSDAFYRDLRQRLPTPPARLPRRRSVWGPRLVLVAILTTIVAGVAGAGIGYAVAPKHRSVVVTPVHRISGDPTTIPGPQFAQTDGWTTDQTGAHPASDEDTPVAVASTIPLTGSDAFPAFPDSTLAALPADGIVLWATAYPPFGPTSGFFPPRTLPFKIADAVEVDPQWEGQPNSSVPQYVLLGTVDGIQLDVRVYFGTQNPGDDLVAKAQAELDTLSLQ